jgi:hypothetical protein
MTTNAMTEAMNTALATAKSPLRLPGLPERIWTYLRDNPHRTCVEVAKAIHSRESHVSATMWTMFHGAPSTLSRQRGSRQGRGVFEYATLGREYEPSRKPASKKGTVTQVTPIEMVEPAARPTMVAVSLAPKATPPKATSHGVDLESLTLGQLRALRDDLNNLFRSL